MIAPARTHFSAEVRETVSTTFLRHGALAGLFGAALLAAWFLYVDVLRGKPLFTPTFLASALLGSGASATMEASLGLALLYTLFHGLVFVGIGVGAAYLLHHFEVVRHRGLIIVLLFTALCIGFALLASNVSILGPQTIAIQNALVGNAIAAFGIGAYLARFWSRSDEP